MKKIYLSKCIFTSETTIPFDGAIVTEDGIIKYVGDTDEAMRLHKDAEVENLGNRTVTAGLIDAHAHVYAGIKMDQLTSFAVDPFLPDDEIIESIKKFISENEVERDCVYLIFNYDFETSERLTKYRLDELFGRDTPVVILDISLHAGAFSSKALEVLDFDPDAPIPYGTTIEYEDDGTIGYIAETLYFELYKKIILADEMGDNDAVVDMTIDGAQKLFNSNGYTTVVDMIPLGKSNLEIWNEKRYREREAEDSLTLRVGVCTDLTADKDEWIRRKNTLQGDFVFHCGLKGFVDGGFMNSTAWTSKPYIDGVNKDSCAGPTNDMELYKRKIKEANECGILVRLHAEGDRAISEALNMYEAANCKDVLNQVEHATSMTDSVIEQIKEYVKDRKLMINMQPIFLYNEAPSEEHPVTCGVDFYNRTAVRVRSAMDAGAMVSLGSADFPATVPIISDHIRIAINRLSDEKKSYYYKTGYTMEQVVNLPELLIAMTHISATAICKENCLGMLKPEYKADITVFDNNLFEMNPLDYKDITIYKTIVDGKIAYEKESEA